VLVLESYGKTYIKVRDMTRTPTPKNHSL